MIDDQDAESEFMDNSWPQFNTTPCCFYWYINGFYDTMGVIWCLKISKFVELIYDYVISTYLHRVFKQSESGMLAR